MRDPGERLLALARERVVFSESEPADTVLVRLTPDQALSGEFPIRDSGTPYGFFSSTKNTEVVVCFIGVESDEEKERVILEAALGMRDNPLFG